MPDRDQYSTEEDDSDTEGDPEPEHHGDVGGAVADVEEPLQIGLENAGHAKGKSEQEHGDGHDPEAPLPRRVPVFADIFQAGEREVEDGQVQKPVGSEK